MAALGWSLTSPSATLRLDATEVGVPVGPGSTAGSLMLYAVGRCIAWATLLTFCSLGGIG